MLLCLGVNTCDSVQLLNCSVSELLSVRGIRIRLCFCYRSEASGVDASTVYVPGKINMYIR